MSKIREQIFNAKGGAPLAATLSSLVEQACQQSKVSKNTLIEEMAKEAGLQKSSLLRILKGKVKAPPAKRLEGIAKVLEYRVKCK